VRKQRRKLLDTDRTSGHGLEKSPKGKGVCREGIVIMGAKGGKVWDE